MRVTASLGTAQFWTTFPEPKCNQSDCIVDSVTLVTTVVITLSTIDNAGALEKKDLL